MTGQELREWRNLRGYSRAFVAEIVGRSRRTVEYWEQHPDEPIPDVSAELLRRFRSENALRVRTTPTIMAEIERVAQERNIAPEELAAEVITRYFLPAASLRAAEEPGEYQAPPRNGPRTE